MFLFQTPDRIILYHDNFNFGDTETFEMHMNFKIHISLNFRYTLKLTRQYMQRDCNFRRL